MAFLVGSLNDASRQCAAADTVGRRWALILVGLPGDVEHAAQFQTTATAWENWLLNSASFPREGIIRLPSFGKDKDQPVPALTADGIRKALADLQSRIGPHDSVWIFTLGHGHYDGQRAWFHVAGRDPSNDEFGRWLSELKCREQVIWLTHSSSGWFVKPLSRAGRIVIAATAADDESNETEFPHALATVMQWPASKLDTDHDQQVSVAELFTATLAEIKQRFDSDKRLPTEHPQLDDNGDGQGSESIELPSPMPKAGEGSESSRSKADGDLARQTFVPRHSKPDPTDPSLKLKLEKDDSVP